MDREETLKSIFTLPKDKFFLMAGPCVVEGLKVSFEIASSLAFTCRELDIPFIFKGSYRKANRSRLDSFTGIGDKRALKVLGDIKKTVQVPIVTDIHESHEAEMAAEVADILQIPAFLFRQTELLVAAAKTGKIVNIKKGQFASASAMKFAADKIVESGNDKVLLTERGNSFGYGDLVVDMRNIPWMKEHGFPVVMDITHSLQQPNSASGVTGGLPHLINTIASSAIAAGADGIFLETHPVPSKAKSDGANMLPLDQVRPLLEKLLRIKAASL
jgi:2-dehydro-3-deoxyphosphooctonate aldolase (KDO 8-P synthase)